MIFVFPHDRALHSLYTLRWTSRFPGQELSVSTGSGQFWDSAYAWTITSYMQTQFYTFAKWTGWILSSATSVSLFYQLLIRLVLQSIVQGNSSTIYFIWAATHILIFASQFTILGHAFTTNRLLGLGCTLIQILPQRHLNLLGHMYNVRFQCCLKITLTNKSEEHVVNHNLFRIICV